MITHGQFCENSAPITHTQTHGNASLSCRACCLQMKSELKTPSLDVNVHSSVKILCAVSAKLASKDQEHGGEHQEVYARRQMSSLYSLTA